MNENTIYIRKQTTLFKGIDQQPIEATAYFKQLKNGKFKLFAYATNKQDAYYFKHLIENSDDTELVEDEERANELLKNLDSKILYVK